MAGVARSCASWGCSVVFVFAIVVAAERPGQAQTPPAAPAEPSKAWTTTASLGLTVTSGNTETSTFNAGFDVKFDPKTNNLFKAEGLLLRGKTSGELSTSRFGFILRDEHRVSQRVFVFGQNQYLKDRFKEIDYLVAPTAGVGITLVSTEATRFNIDAGAGGVWEKNTRGRVRSSGALTLGEKVTHALSTSVAVTQTFGGLWKTSNLNDALYSISAGLAASLSARTQVKIEWLDTYKTRPPAENIKKNDVSVIIAFVFKS